MLGICAYSAGRKGNFISKKVVPKVGVEPTRHCWQRFLRPPRLPFRHFGIKCHCIVNFQLMSRKEDVKDLRKTFGYDEIRFTPLNLPRSYFLYKCVSGLLQLPYNSKECSVISMPWVFPILATKFSIINSKSASRSTSNTRWQAEQ